MKKKYISYEEGNEQLITEGSSYNSSMIEEEKKNQSSKREIREIQTDVIKSSHQRKITIEGIEVIFPYEPYQNQIIYMSKVIEALSKGEIAGLESPTGTGKTLCLLCSSLAWLKYKRNEMIKKNIKDEIIPKIYYNSQNNIII